MPRPRPSRGVWQNDCHYPKMETEMDDMMVDGAGTTAEDAVEEFHSCDK